MLVFSLASVSNVSAATLSIVKVEAVNSGTIKATLSNRTVKYIPLPIKKKLYHGQNYVYINFAKKTKKYTLVKPFISPSFNNAVTKLKALEVTKLELPSDITTAKTKSAATATAIKAIKDASPYQINALKNRKNLMDMNIAGHVEYFTALNSVNALKVLPTATITEVEAFYTHYTENYYMILDAYDYTDNYNLPKLEAKLESLDELNDNIVEEKSSPILNVIKGSTLLVTEKAGDTKDNIFFELNSQNEDLLENVLLFPVVDNVKDFSTIELTSKYFKFELSETPGTLGQVSVTRHPDRQLEFDLYVNYSNFMKLDAKVYHVVIPKAGDVAPITLTAEQQTLPSYYSELLNSNNNLFKSLLPFL
jgi:hypothetical protein